MAEMASERRRILIAVDDSDESVYALRWCLENLASNITPDTLVLLYARPPPPVPIYPSVYGSGYLFTPDVIATMDRYGQGLAAKVMEKAEAICKDFENMEVEKLVAVGDARDVICDKAEKLGVDMLVMGSHSYGFIKRAFLGSVSNHCVNNVKCPVMIVKRPKQ